jgi:hypothetical protein
VSAGPTRDYGECRAPPRATPWPWANYGEDQSLSTASTEGEPERKVRGSHAERDSLGYCDGMWNPFRDSAEKITGDVDDDTIELMLSSEQMRALSRAAAADTAAPVATPVNPAAPAAGPVAPAAAAPTAGPAAPASLPKANVAPANCDPGARRAATTPLARHWPAGGIAAIVGVTVVLGTLVALGAIAQRTSERKPLAAATSAPAPVPPAPAASPPPPPPGEPIRFKNPFDRSEVFEFPPGTSPAEARQAVAQLLMERARDRHVKFVERKHGAVRKAAAHGGAIGADLVQNSVR